MAPLAWLAAAALHIALWTRRSAAPILYLAVYWLLAAVSSASILWQQLLTDASPNHVEVYIQCLSMLLTLLISAVDCICFYDEVILCFSLVSNKFTSINAISMFFPRLVFIWEIHVIEGRRQYNYLQVLPFFIYLLIFSLKT